MVTITRPVKRQITTVPQKVAVIATSDCLYGFLVEAAQEIIGEDPIPLSFENKPLAHPNCKVAAIPLPIKPPKALRPVKAVSIIKQIAGHRYTQFIQINAIDPPTYKTQINGIRVSQTFEIILILPKITSALAAVINIAKTQFGVSGIIAEKEFEIAEV